MSVAAAAFRAALTFKRLSWQYRRWALEEEAAGDLDQYRRHATEARRLWSQAKDYINWARSHSDAA